MVPVEPLQFLLLALLGGLVAIDGTSFGQFMISRPFVAATLAGAVVGRPTEGALIGLVLEAFHLNVLPVGAAKYPEGGPAAVSGGAVFASAVPESGMLLLVVLVVLGFEWIGGETVRYMRQGNMHLVPVENVPLLNARKLERGHLLAILTDFGRGMGLVIVGLPLLAVIVSLIGPYWGLSETISQAVVAAIITALLASAMRVMGAQGWLTAVGAVAGLAILLLR